MKQQRSLQLFKFALAQSRLPENAADRTSGDFTMLWNSRRARPFGCRLNKLDMASRLVHSSEARCLQLAFHLTEMLRFHAATSTSIVRIYGATVATGGVK